MSEQPPTEPALPPLPPTPPPEQRSGCATAIMVVIGLILLLPGLCVVLLTTLLPAHVGHEEVQLLILCGIAAIAGIALIVWAARRP